MLIKPQILRAFRERCPEASIDAEDQPAMGIHWLVAISSINSHSRRSWGTHG